MQPSEVQSTTSLSSNAKREELVQLETQSKLDFLFPLFDQIFQNISIPNIIVSLCSIYTYLQMMYTAIWPTDPYYSQDIEFKEQSNTFLRYAGFIFWWLPRSSTFDEYFRSFIACLVLTVLFIGFTIAVCVQYYLTRKFIRWTLYPINLIFTCLSQIMLHPIACLIGSGMKYGIAKHNTTFYIFAAVSLLMFAVQLFVYYIGLSFTCKTIYIRLSPMSMWDYVPFFLYMEISTVSIIALLFFSEYAEFCGLVIKLMNACAMLYVHIRTYNQPFHIVFYNSLAAGMSFSCIINDIFMFGVYFVNANVFIFLPVIVFFAVLVITVPIFHITNKKRNDKINKLLSQSENEDFDFVSLNILGNIYKAEYYCRTGFAMRSPRFLDWSLIKFLHMNLPTTCFANAQLISFFPTEWRTLNQLYHTCTNNIRISYPNKFLLYEVNKLKTLRQYSNSKMALENVSNMKMMSVQIENIIRSMWKAKVYSIRQFEDYSAKCNDMESIYEEGLCDYPNNAKLCDEYACFLAECRTNYIKAVKISSRAMLVEEGRNFVKDNCFKLMVKAFPLYLKRRVLDPQGGFIKQVTANKGSANSSAKAQVYSSGSQSNGLVNTELEEQLGRQILTNGKQRIALDHAVNNKQFGTQYFHKFFTVISFLLNIIIFIIIHFYFAQVFVARKESTEGNFKAMQLRFYCTLSIIAGQMKFGIESGRNPSNDFLAGARAIDGIRRNYLDELIPFNITTTSYVFTAEDYLTQFIELITKFNDEGIDTAVIAKQMTNRISKNYNCRNKKSIGYSNTSLVVSLNAFLLSSEKLAIKDANNESWYQSDEYCESSLNYYTVMDDLLELINSLDDYQEEYRSNLSKQLMFFLGIGTVAIFGWNCIPIIINVTIFCRQIKKIQKVFLSLDKNIHDHATRKILRNGDNESEIDIQANKENNKPPKVIISATIAVILGIGIAFLMFGIVYNTDDVNTNIKNLNYWMNYVTMRLTKSAESFHAALDALYMNESLPLSFTTREKKVNEALDAAKLAQQNSWYLITGSEDAPSIIGYDEEFDFINTKNDCEFTTGGPENLRVHNLIMCSSTSGALDLYCEMVSESVQEVERYDGTLNFEMPQYMIHMGSIHLWSFLGVTIDRITVLVQITYNKMIDTSMTIMFCSFAVSIIFMLVNLSIMYYMKLSTDTVYTMIKRISPLDLINNKKLMNFLLNQKDDEGITTINLSHSILHQSADGLVMASLNGTTESVNPAITNILGFKPEQLLGQHASSIFSTEDRKTVETQLIMMANKECGPVYEDHLICLNDSEMVVPCFVSILLMFEHGTEVPHSFIILVRDESELIKMQKAAEESKEKSERLLYQILPRDIVIKLNSGEKEIAFNVPSASIIFIDIQRFSHYCQSLTPSDIMIHLSTLFAAFDQQAAKYPLITKIKLIGDDYMAASGLFLKEDEQPSKHAEQILRFALDCLVALDEVNIKMSSSLQVRIGVNSGGPLIAGVLGTDKPVFDIIGDPINIAARLQTTDICGKVHISQNTFELIQGLDFACEPRGEVFLKGKGKTNTYFVLPMSSFMLSSSSINLTNASVPHAG